MINLRSIDMNLLPVFEAVFEERSMTRAADRLAMSQPAVSNAIARLRSALRDELFVPGRRGTAVTPIAEQVYPRVKAALDAVREGLGQTREFDPRQSDRRFAIGTLYGPGLRFWQSVADWLKHDAPLLGLKVVQPELRETAIAALREGRLDFLLDYALPTASDLEASVLFRDELIVVASASHPRVGQTLTRRQFLAERHAVHSSLRVPGSLAQIEAALGDRTLDVAVEVRGPFELPIVAAGTEYIAVCNRLLAHSWTGLLPLKLLPLPFRVPQLKGHLIWHASRKRDAGHRWVRDSVLRLAKDHP
jgi:DNA-binding transcriptional LysR family regulator